METRPQNQNEQQKQQRALFTPIFIHFHSFASTLELWRVVGIKSIEKPERATTDNEKQRKAAKSKHRQWNFIAQQVQMEIRLYIQVQIM